MSDLGLRFFYGGYTHPAGEVYPRRIEVRPVKSQRGVRWASEYRIEIGGDFVRGDGVAGGLTRDEVKARVDLLNQTYKYDYRDCGFILPDDSKVQQLLTDDIDNLSGNQVIFRSWDNVLPTEWANTRSFTVVISALFRESYSNILYFSETLTQHGTGGPRWVKRNLWSENPQREVVAAKTKIHIVQSGVIQGTSGYIALPSPWWPDDEQTWRRTIATTGPRYHGHPSFDRGTHYTKSYQYHFDLTPGEYDPQFPIGWPLGGIQLGVP